MFGRRTVASIWIVLCVLIVSIATACSSGAPEAATKPAPGQKPSETPQAPASSQSTGKGVKITIMDAAGDLQVSKRIIEAYKAKHPEVISEIEYQTTTAPELTSKIKAQQMAGKVDISAVIVGPDGASAGMQEDVWSKIPDFEKNFPSGNYTPIAKEFNATFGQGYGVLINLYPSGQFFLYNPDKVKTEPRAWSAQELLDWAKNNKGKFMYARPANSGPGRQFLQCLPYVLGDKDPRDPAKGWDKTWAYLKELNQYVDYYPSGTGATLKEFAEGSRDIVASTMGWDMSPRAQKTIPRSSQVFWMQDFVYVAGGNFWLLPKGVEPAKQQAVMELIKYMLAPEVQAEQYLNGFNYPGPAIKGVTLSMASKEVQDSVKPYLRPFYDELLTKNKQVLSLGVQEMVTAFDMWDKLVGSKVKSN